MNRILQVVPIALFLEAATLNKTVSLDLTLGKDGLAKYKKEPSMCPSSRHDARIPKLIFIRYDLVTIKEGAEFSVGIKFR